MNRLYRMFYDSYTSNPNHLAVLDDKNEYSYEEIYRKVLKLANHIRSKLKANQRVLVYLNRNVEAYAAILAVLYSDCSFVPLNPLHPRERNDRIVKLSQAELIITDQSVLEEFPLTDDLTLECIDILNLPNNIEINHNPIIETEVDNEAYVLFTSGSTGEPKGVSVPVGAVCAYIENFNELYTIGAGDRVSQFFELTFDLSIHDQFVTWSNGATLCTIPEKVKLFPAKYIIDKSITIWFSVPSAVDLMAKLKMFSRIKNEQLRLSLFCGEALNYMSLRKWHHYAPKSKLVNLYGPTEATIAITHRFVPHQELDSEGIVPIGSAFTNQRTMLSDDGELLLSGSQLSNGYINNQEENESKFIKIDANQWYRTGDLARTEEDELRYVGRIDSQYQINGHRVELLDVEETIKNISEDTNLIVLPYNETTKNVASGVRIAYFNQALDVNMLRKRLSKHLTKYMIPQKFDYVADIPLNANGKIDRRKIREIVEGKYD